jgi:hypothetical protein
MMSGQTTTMVSQHRLQTVSRPATQQGSAITEFAVMTVVLVPMFLMFPMLGKIGDMNSTTIQASRYGAWERTVATAGQKSDKQLETEIENRFYTKIDTPIQTGRKPLTKKKYENPLWRGYGKDRLLRSAQKNVKNTMRNSKTPGKAGGALDKVITKLADAFSFGGNSSGFNVNRNGLYRSNVAVDVGSNKMGFLGTKDCTGAKSAKVFTCIQRHNVILTDTYDSGNPTEAANRTRGLVPTAVFSDVNDLFKVIGKFPLMREFSGFRAGYVNPEVIPGDRLGPKK